MSGVQEDIYECSHPHMRYMRDSYEDFMRRARTAPLQDFPWVQVRRTAIGDLGLFARSPILEGEIVLDYGSVLFSLSSTLKGALQRPPHGALRPPDAPEESLGEWEESRGRRRQQLLPRAAARE